MKLRTKLVLAFLVLAVLPLAGITLVSYASSVRAFRATVEAESEALTEEMGSRMELVTRELDRRIEGLGDLPYDAVLAREEAVGDDEVDRFLGGLMTRMGESAALLESLEFVPIAPPAPPDPTRPPPPVAPMVIHLSDLWKGEEPDEGATDPSVRVVRIANVSAFVPKDWLAGQALEAAQPVLDALMEEELLGDLEVLGVEASEGDFEGLLELVGERIEAAVDASARHAEARQHLELLQAQVEERAVEHERERRAPRFALEREFGCAVRREGEVVAQVKARVNTGRVLQSVLERTRTDQGEIPFAIDAEGNVHTPDPAGRETIEELGLANRLTGENGEAPVIADDWVAVARDEPSLGLRFGIARPVGKHLREIRNATGRNLFYGLALVSLAMFGIVPLSSRMTRNLTTLTDGVERLAAGDLSAQVPVRTRDEIGRLGGAFNRMAQELSDNQRELLAQARMRRELELCRQIQEELLPRRSVRLPFAELRAVSIPAREVGGDFFNYFPLPDGSVALLMGDVSGKGMPAALLMANVQATLRARLPLETDLARLADALDREMEAGTPAETYLTLFVAVVQPGAQRMRYVNAGHNVQYLAGPGDKLERLESSGRPLGLLSGGGYAERAVELRDGDLLCLFTDGLTEAENAAGDEFGGERLESLLREVATNPADDVLARIEGEVRKHRGQVEAADDATVMVLSVRAR